MRASKEQVLNGIVRYADNEVMVNLPTTGKWVVGTGIGIAMAKADHIIESLKENSIVQMLNLIDDNGMIDYDCILDHMRESAIKYGNVTMNIPLVGNLTFNENDIESLKRQIEMR